MSTNPGQYCVRLEDGEELLVDIDYVGGQYVARVGGRSHRLGLRHGPNGHLVVDIDERSYRLRGHNGESRLVADGHESELAGMVAWNAGSRHLRTATGTASEAPLAARHRVTSPLTGLVSVVSVAPGERVSRGQTLLVIEAMKMENRVTAPCDGLVSELHVGVGQTVRLRDPLVSLRSE